MVIKLVLVAIGKETLQHHQGIQFLENLKQPSIALGEDQGIHLSVIKVTGSFGLEYGLLDKAVELTAGLARPIKVIPHTGNINFIQLEHLLHFLLFANE